MTGARGCNILVDGSEIYGIHKDEKKEISKKENEKYNTRLG
jgi:hypothetical protein